ncbi:ROK family protein [Streptomyces purpurascens]
MAVALPEGVPVHLENNVNCAALAELHEGAAVGRDTFGYLRIGVGIGLAVVIGGRVLRGANGAAGEVARLPYPWDESRAPATTRALSSAWDRAPCSAGRPRPGRTPTAPAPRTAERLLTLSGQGHATARAVLDAHAADVGRLAAAVVAVMDPGLIVLGGATARMPQLLPGVRAELARLSWPTEVVSSVVGDTGTVAGASKLAVAHGIQTVTGAVLAKH